MMQHDTQYRTGVNVRRSDFAATNDFKSKVREAIKEFRSDDATRADELVEKIEALMRGSAL